MCNACAPWFRDPQKCPSCGRMSRHMSRVRRLGIEEPVCPSCQQADHAVCPACRRYRRLFEMDDGKMLCRRCLEEGTGSCPACGDPMPAGRGNLCEACYWKGLLDKRVKICQAGLGKLLAEEFKEFGAWFEGRRGAQAAALRVNKYLTFFQEMDAKWGHIPSYGDLLRRFHAEGLRRVRLVVSWMEESGRVKVDEKLREEDSEYLRIRRLKARIDASSAGGALWDGYRKNLMEHHRQGRTSLRSIRMALSSAAELVRRAGGHAPTQSSLDAYLQDKPGQKANITGFVNHVNNDGVANLVIQNSESMSRSERKRLEQALISMMKHQEDTQGFRKMWICAAMRYFQGRPLRKDHSWREDPQGGLIVRMAGLEFWIPLPKGIGGK